MCSFALAFSETVLPKLTIASVVDDSGTINSIEELQMLTVNMCFHLDLPMVHGDIEIRMRNVGHLDNSNAWTPQDYHEWFKRSFY